MKYLMVLLLVVVIAAVLLYRKKTAKAPAAAGSAPKAQDSLKLELENRMEDFLNRDLFCLVIQPVVDFRDNTAFNGEVLSRLNHPERGVVFPDTFLPALDAMGLYPRFDRYIFRKSCAWLRRTAEAGERFDCLSCNFSRKSLSEAGIVQDLIQIADSYGIPHGKLGVEITEWEKETDVQQLMTNLKQLQEAGFRIFLDDFGNGVTSVIDLVQYPLDIVKIDRSLLLKAETEQGAAVFKDLVSMAIHLGAEVVCEGIETEEQNRFAREAGCHYGQGFLFFKPTSTEQVFETMRRGSIFEEEA